MYIYISYFLLQNQKENEMLMASCTELTIQNNLQPSTSININARDCINGTLMPRNTFELSRSDGKTNYTEINQLFVQQGHLHKLDGDGARKIPYDTDITIYSKTKVCVHLNI